MKKNRFFDVPPGKNIKNQCYLFLSVYIMAILWSLKFFSAWQEAYEDRIVLNAYPRFEDMIQGCFLGFLILFLLCVVTIGFNFRDYKIESKSIYVMRRVPDKMLLVRQCISVPGAVIILAIITVLVLLEIYYLIFRYSNSGIPVDPFSWNRLWRCFL